MEWLYFELNECGLSAKNEWIFLKMKKPAGKNLKVNPQIPGIACKFPVL